MLYDSLGLVSLETAAKQRAARSLLVFSGLWGAVRVTDRIPSYRCSMGVKLPGIGALGAHWRTPMASALPDAMRRRTRARPALLGVRGRVEAEG